ncbi:MAG: U32 family peptidase [Dehalococcoidales bacterium]|nr:U32 family peptidase [Dehalococcoidales bacterium]
MNLLVPTNWDKELIKSLGKIKASIQVYGVLPTSIIGSGGSGPDIPQMTTTEAEEYIKLVHSAGLTFNYLLNAPCLNNMEWDRDTHRKLLHHLEWLSNAGVNGVTVAIPYLMELIKRQFPHLKVEVSTIAHVNSVARARFFEALGVDAIMLDANINRDFKLLKAIRSAVNCELSVLTNSLCLYQCPYENYHYNTLGHASQIPHPLNGAYMDYPVFHCTLARFTDPAQFIKSRWIRPEDISAYQEIGIDFFKIAGRMMTTEWIVNAVEAYSSLNYPGNLGDILYIPPPKFQYMGQDLTRAQMATIASLPKVYIDNQALDGFLGYFKRKNCPADCEHCEYCQKVADKAVRFTRYEVDKYTAVLRECLDRLTSSRLFEAREQSDIESVINRL